MIKRGINYSNIATTSYVGLLSEQPGWWDNLLLGVEYDKADEDQENRLKQIATNAIEETTSFRKPESEINEKQAETSINDDLSGKELGIA